MTQPKRKTRRMWGVVLRDDPLHSVWFHKGTAKHEAAGYPDAEVIPVLVSWSSPQKRKGKRK